MGFYATRVEPAMARLHEEGPDEGRGDRWQLGADVTLSFVSRMTDFAGCTMGGLNGSWEIQKRCFAGLLREGLVELVVRVLEEVRGRMEVFVRCADEAVGLGAVRWKGMRCDVQSMLLRGMVLQTKCWEGILSGLLLNPRFRSERLEILLLKYLREDAGERGARVGRKVREVTMNKMIGKLRKPKKWSTYHEATDDRDSEWEDVFLETGWTQVPKPFLHGYKMLEWWNARLKEQKNARTKTED